MNPFEGEVCRNKHKRTLQNTRMYNCNHTMRVKLACRECSRRAYRRKKQLARRVGTGIGRGTPQMLKTQYLWEDIEFMLQSRPTFAILESSGYSRWDNLIRGAQRNAPHLTERLREKRGNE